MTIQDTTKLKGNNHYLGNPHVKQDGVAEDWTPEKVQEYAKCMADPVHFVRDHIKIINLNDGLVPFEPYPYQEKMFSHFRENRFSIVLACRQSGKSISSLAFLLWYVLFNPEQTVAILANRGATSREMLSRITLMLENLPFYLQPGCKTLNKSMVEFSNNSRILAESTSSSSIRGYSVNLLFLDEFAFVERATEFYTSTYPVISSGKDTKVIITSTANGIGNQFHKIWQGAEQRVNEYKPFRVDWWDVPGRDEEWKLETINNTSQLQFDQEFGNTFFGTGQTLINAQTLLGLKAINPKRILEGGSLLIYDEVRKDSKYVMLVDVAKGRGQDYSTFNVIDISARPFKQVAVYRDNLISPILFPDIIYKYANLYNEAYVVIESNDTGQLTCHGLYQELEYENIYMSNATKSTGVGVEMNKKIKRIGCSGFKDLLEENKLEVVDEETIMEISTFEAKGSSYEASEGNHDDLVMNFVLLGYLVSTVAFQELTDINTKKLMFKRRMQEIEADVPPFGFINTGAQEEDMITYEEKLDPWSLINKDNDDEPAFENFKFLP
ncbi:MAG: terminase family protein [Candidatus Poseidoniales archaeon]